MSFISSLFGGGSNTGGSNSNPTTASSYIPTGQATEDQDWQTLLAQLQNNNVPGQLYPQIASTAQSVVNNPYAPAAQTAAGNAGTASTAIGNQAVTDAGTLSSTGNALIPYATQVLNMGLDPQSAIYNQTLQQTQDQINAENAASGIGTSPVGAQIDANALNNFNLNWQNNLLNRANTAAGGANLINATGASDLAQAPTVGAAGVSAINAGGQLPYANFNTNLGNALTALNAQSNAGVTANTQTKNVLSALQSYLGLGQTAEANNTNAANTNFANTLTAANAAGNAVSAIPSLSSLQSLFGSTPSSAAYVASSPASQVATDVAAGDSSSGGILDAITSLFG